MVEFSIPVVEVEVWDADATEIDDEQKFWIFAPKYRDKFITITDQWKFNFMGKTEQDNVQGSVIEFLKKN